MPNESSVSCSSRTTFQGEREFACCRCGACCRTSGYVHLTKADIDAIAGQLGISITEFTERYTRLTQNRTGLSLVEQNSGACVFLSERDECIIEAAKPLQCRQFPFVWRYKNMQQSCKGWSRNEDGQD